MATYSEMHREDALRDIALRQKIEELGDTDLMRLDAECAKEIRSEWATQARSLVDELTPDAQHGCACDICAITDGLTAAVTRGI